MNYLPQVKSAIRIAGWQVISKMITFVASAWAARCLGPEFLGISGMVLAWVSGATIFSMWPHDTLLIREIKATPDIPYKLGVIRGARKIRLLCSIAIGLFTGAVTFFFLPSDTWLLAWFAGVVMYILSLQQPLWCLIAQEQMVANARVQAIGSILVGLLFLSFFRPGQAAGSDLVVTICGTTLTTIMGWRYAMSGLPRVDASRSVPFWPLVKQSRWLFGTGLTAYIYVASEAPLLGWLRSIDELGIYRTAIMLATSAQSFLTILPSLLYPRFIEWQKESPSLLWKRQCHIAYLCVLIGLPILVLFFIFTPIFYPIIFGDEFRGAALPFCLLLTSKWVVLLNNIFLFGLWAGSHDKEVLVLAMAPAAVLSLVLNTIFVPHYGMIASAAINLFSETFVLTTCIFIMRHKVMTHSTSA